MMTECLLALRRAEVPKILMYDNLMRFFFGACTLLRETCPMGSKFEEGTRVRGTDKTIVLQKEKRK